jgi:hypothetical protein
MGVIGSNVRGVLVDFGLWIRSRKALPAGSGHFGRALPPVSFLSEAQALRRNQEILIPEMISIPGTQGKTIMKFEVSVGLFNQVMEGYEIIGPHAGKLKAILLDSAMQSKPLTYVSYVEARAFAERLSHITDRTFRLQTEAEWRAARDLLSGENWTWTETVYSPGAFVLCRLGSDEPDYNYYDLAWSDYAIRLVEVPKLTIFPR